MTDRNSTTDPLAALREREQRYRAYFERGPHAIYVVDAEGRYVDANPAACAQAGYTRAELLRLTVRDLSAKSGHPAAFEALRRNGTVTVDTQLRRKDGSTFAASLDAAALGPDRYIACVTDITALKAHEDELRRERDRAQGYLDTVEAMIVVLDVDGNISLINRKGCRLLGYREDELVGASWFGRCLPQPDGLEEVYPYFRRLITGEAEAVEYFENPVVTRSGELREIAWHNALLRNDDGAIVGTLSAGEDITDRKRLEQQLAQTQRLEAIGTLAGGVAHDMNNVLAVVLGLASVASAQLPADHPARAHLANIVAAADRGKSLVGSLLGYARKGQYEKRPLLLNETIASLASVLRQSLPKRITVDVRADPRLGVIRGDDAQITQMLMNLCINAADAIADRGTITIETRDVHLAPGEVPQLIGGRYARIDVTDDGAGMPAEVQARAFEPFFTTKDIGEGTGLGLSMAYGVATNHHGAIALDSTPGAGTTVNLWLPVAESLSEPIHAVEAQAAATDDAAASATILVVDDEPLVRNVLCQMLDFLGYATIGADGGRRAIELYRDRGDDIDLVVLDLSMPDMDGAEVFTALREIDPEARVLLCTGHGEEAKTDELRRRGAVGIARKPFGPDELERALERALLR